MLNIEERLQTNLIVEGFDGLHGVSFGIAGD